VPAWRAFDKAGAGITNLWSSTLANYTNFNVAASSNTYAGSSTTVDVGGNVYPGEWLQVQVASAIVLSTYQIQSRSDLGNGNGEPKTWYLLGSSNGTSWYLVDQRSNVVWGGASSINTMTVQANQAFTSYRIVIYVPGASFSNATNAVIGEWTLNGSIEGPNVTPDGRLGLGVTNPTQALEVAGSAVVAGTLSAGNPLMFRNALYNGDMRINQRGISTNWASPTAAGTTTGGIIGCDRWNIYRGSYATGAVVAQLSLAATDAPYLDGIQFYQRIGRTSGNSGTQVIACDYNIESRDSYRFVGQQGTFSFWYRTGAGLSGTLVPSFFGGTGTDQAARNGLTGISTFAYLNLPVSNTWQKASMTGFVNNSFSQVGVNFAYVPSGTAGGFDYFDVTGVQLEKGSVATPYEIRPYATELALCQRYFQKYGGTNTYERFGMGMWVFSNQAYITKPFIAPMRAAPTLVQTGSMRTYSNNLGYTAVTAVAIDQATLQGTNLAVSIAGTVFTGWPASLESSGDATASLQFSAEL
jgi:hypothetical protein